MSPTNAVSIFLITAAALCCCSSANRHSRPSHGFVLDTDAFVVRQPAENIRGCNSISGDRPFVADSRIAESNNFQMPEENTANEVPLEENTVHTKNRQSSKCHNLPYTDYSELSAKSRVFYVHNGICLKLNFYPCVLPNILSFKLKGQVFFDKRHYIVTVEDGKIFGLSDFNASYKANESDFQVLLKWENIHMYFRFKTDEKGRDDVREYVVQIPLLYLYAHKPDRSTPSKVELTRVGDLIFEPVETRDMSSVVEWSFENVKSRIRQFLDDELRIFLVDSVKEVLDGRAYQSTTTFCEGFKLDRIEQNSDKTVFERILKVRTK